MKSKLRKVLAGIITFAVLGVTAAVPAFAADKTDTGTGSVTGNVTINGSISPLTISVTHPINVAYAISPDAETYTAPDITVTNNTNAQRLFFFIVIENPLCIVNSGHLGRR
ncbi:MAG: hypothetical protein VB023_07005 [Oscillibacter sp.]|nr:hypothetical protein [Oscillibacter sp.]